MPERLPARVRPWWNLSIMGEHQTGVDHLLLLAVMDRESACGQALRPSGPAGTGDWTPRRWSRYATRRDPERFRRWQPTRDEYELLVHRRLGESENVPELCMPIDGLGWGRGLMQLDWAEYQAPGFFDEVVESGTPAWKDAWRNLRGGAAYLADLIHLFKADEALAVAAYNAGPERVRGALVQLSEPMTDARRLAEADRVTTHGNYMSDVLARRDRFRVALSTPKEESSE